MYKRYQNTPSSRLPTLASCLYIPDKTNHMLYLSSRNKKKWLSLCRVPVCLLLIPFSLTGQVSMSLEDCIETALKNNIAIADVQNRQELARITLEQSRMQRLPQTNINISQGINTGRSIDPFTNLYINKTTGFGNAGISLELPLFSGMQLSNTIKRNKTVLGSLTHDATTAKNNLVLQLIAAYISVVQNAEVEKASVVQLKNSKDQLNIAEAKVKAGVMAENQLAELQALVAAEELNLENTRYALELSRLELFLLLNIAPNKNTNFLPLTATEALPSASSLNAEHLYQEALRHFPEIKSMLLRKQSAELDWRIARGTRLPVLSLFSGLNSNYSSSAPSTRFEPDGSTRSDIITSTTNFINVGGSDYYLKEKRTVQNGTESPFGFFNQMIFNRSFNIGLSLRIPVFNGFAARYRMHTAKANLLFAEQQYLTAQTQLLNAISQAITNYDNCQQRIILLTRQEKAYKQSVLNSAERLKAGVGSPADYALAKTNYDRTTISRIQAGHEQALRWRIIQFYQAGNWKQAP